MAYLNLQAATPGMLDGMQSNSIESWPTTDRVRFGFPVQIEKNGTCKTSTSKEADGIAVLSQVHCDKDDISGMYMPKDIVAVLKSGRIWASVSGAVEIGDVLGVESNGRFSKAAAAANAPDRMSVVARTANVSGFGTVIVEVTPK